MTISHQPKSMYEINHQYSYQQNFEVALLNLEEVIREERMLKRVRKHKDKSNRNG